MNISQIIDDPGRLPMGVFGAFGGPSDEFWEDHPLQSHD